MSAPVVEMTVSSLGMMMMMVMMMVMMMIILNQAMHGDHMSRP
jgi:hypothetical protein